MTIQQEMANPVDAALAGVVPGPVTVPPAGGAPPDAPRSVSARSLEDVSGVVGAGVASLAVTWMTYGQIMPTTGLVGFLLLWFGLMIGFYAAATALSQPRPIVLDRIAAAVVHGGAAIVGIALVSAIVFTVIEGWPAFHHVNFFSQDMAGVRPSDPYTKGGILHAIVGSMIEITIAVGFALPLGIGAAIYMSEIGGRFARIVRTVVEAMTALPDLIAGLFIYAVVIIGLNQFHPGPLRYLNARNGFAAALAISVTMLPIIARSSEVVLRVVPGGLREAGQALGATQWSTVWRIVLPTARPGLATAMILGIARGIGETAPVLITSGASTFLNSNPFVDPMNSLPLFIYSAVKSGEPSYITRGYAAGITLLIVVMFLFVVTRFLARNKKVSR